MSEKILFHFDIKQSCMPVDDFVITATSLQKVCNQFASKCFVNTTYDLSICPVENGSIKDFFIGTLVGGLLLNGASDYMGGFIKGLTGKSLTEYGENNAVLFKEMVIGFYSQDVERLKIPEELNLDVAVKAKSDFYTMCCNNQDIKGLGFHSNDEFPIKRSDFPRYVSKDIIRDLPDELVLHELIVYKPINIPSDNQWSFKDNKTQSIINATINDEGFKNGFLSGKYPLKSSKQNDIIIALLRYKRKMINGEEKIVGKEIDTVFKFNDKNIKPLPDNILFNLPKYDKSQKSEKEENLDLFNF